jgi:hypothetical protein
MRDREPLFRLPLPPGGTTVNTSGSGDVMVRNVTTQPIASGVTARFAA